jgi:hypothetical protein
MTTQRVLQPPRPALMYDQRYISGLGASGPRVVACLCGAVVGVAGFVGAIVFLYGWLVRWAGVATG